MTCLACGTQLVRKGYEKPYQFAKRTTCGKSCAQRLRVKAVLSPNTRYRRVKVNGKPKQLSRHLVESALGRPLRRDEIVHHVNHDKLDDRLDNYEIVDAAAHAKHHNQKHPLTKLCVTCGTEFRPLPTKRARTQTCSRACKSALLSLRNAQRMPQCAEVIGHVIQQLRGVPS